MIFMKTSTETIPLKKPKNAETIHANMVCQRKVVNIDDILYIVGNFLKNAIQRFLFQKH